MLLHTGSIRRIRHESSQIIWTCGCVRLPKGPCRHSCGQYNIHNTSTWAVQQRWNRVTGQRVTGSAIWVRIGSDYGSKPWPGFLTRILVQYCEKLYRQLQSVSFIMLMQATPLRHCDALSCADTVSDTPPGPGLPAYRVILGHNLPN